MIVLPPNLSLLRNPFDSPISSVSTVPTTIMTYSAQVLLHNQSGQTLDCISSISHTSDLTLFLCLDRVKTEFPQSLPSPSTDSIFKFMLYNFRQNSKKIAPPDTQPTPSILQRLLPSLLHCPLLTPPSSPHLMALSHATPGNATMVLSPFPNI